MPRPDGTPSPDLVRCYLVDTSRLLVAHRRSVVDGRPAPFGIPKLILEMVRCIAVVEHSGCHDGEVAVLSRRLLAGLARVETLAPGPRLDQSLQELVAGWQAFVSCTLAGTEPAPESLPEQPSAVVRTHPSTAAPYLHEQMPCTGLVRAASLGFCLGDRPVDRL